ncbi:putative wall-associated receptor kinase, galacturonan-binding domain-containing protein [Helianthus annuus]|nr:putative wall-associated receptor kinase, galacturonan-binding domain-containing protein [Helianthus annuus]KAJ0877171.1 putative wall-associated receptor kinase, galacturonan-binding domain-containing protein [Helianthus annuus]
MSLILFLVLFFFHSHSLPVCRNSCANIEIDYPFGIDDGCGAPLFRNMLNCSTTFTPLTTPTTTTTTNTTAPVLTPTFASPTIASPTTTVTTPSATALFFQTPSGSYKVESIDYASKTVTIYDPSMSTCTILQPHHDFLLSDLQSALIPPSPDTVFALVNCSIDSPVLNHYKSLCFNFSSDHSCDDLYNSCTSFKIFNMLSNDTPPACCFTSYATLKFMSMNILDCTHYTSFYDVDKLKDEKPLDWSYGMKLSYNLPDTGCDRCRRSGGTCGFDVETEGMLCICSPTLNSTRQCGDGPVAGKAGEGLVFLHLSLTIVFVYVYVFIFIS